MLGPGAALSNPLYLTNVIAGLDPAIHRLPKGWMRGSSPRMTVDSTAFRI
jgi:hypothetical protein